MNMPSKVFIALGIAFSTAVSLAGPETIKNAKNQRQPAAHGTPAPFCDDVARKILAANALQKIEDGSTPKDFVLRSSINLGDAADSRVISIYMEPSDKSSYLIELYSEGCGVKALIQL